MEKSVYQDWADNYLLQAGLSNVVSVAVCHNDKFKVTDGSLLGNVMSANKKWYDSGLISVEFLVELNEDLLSQIEVRYGKEELDIALTRIMSAVSFEYEKDKAILLKPDVSEFSGVLAKWGFERIEAHWAAVRQVANPDD